MKKKLLFNTFLVGLALLIFTGCSGNDSDDWESSADMAEVGAVMTESADEAEEAVDWDEEREDDSAEFELNLEEEVRTFEAIPILLPSESGRQLSYDVDFVLETIDFMPSIQLLWETVGALDGYVEHERIHGRSIRRPEAERFANFQLRIPNEELGAFIQFIAANYTIVDYRRDLEDFTLAYERQEANLEVLRGQEQRMLDELDDDDNEDVDGTRSELNDVRSQIRDLEEANALIQRDVDYSEITIRLGEIIIVIPEEEIPEEPPTFGEELQKTFNDTAGALLFTLRILLLIAVTILPWTLVVAGVVIPIVYLVKRQKRKNDKDKMLHG